MLGVQRDTKGGICAIHELHKPAGGFDFDGTYQATIKDLAGTVNLTSQVGGLSGTVQLGSAVSSGGALMGAKTDITNAVSGTVQNTEYTLNSITLPANSLGSNGKAFKVSGYLTLAANANAKNIKLYLGATAIGTITGSTANAKVVYYEATVWRTASGQQNCLCQLWVDTGAAPTMIATAATETDTAAMVLALKTANTAAAAASGTGGGMALEFLN